MNEFTVFPAIDLRDGKVVRLVQGDPTQQTIYGNDPGDIALRWLDAGADWLHVVNLDGAFGDVDQANRRVLGKILSVAERANVQFGGGLRTLADIEQALSLGVRRVVLGTVALENPDVLSKAIEQFGSDRISVGIDARDNQVRIRGWTKVTDSDPITLGHELFRVGVRTVIFTDIARDGVAMGVAVSASKRLAAETGLSVVASGGVKSVDDVSAVRQARLSGVIIGRALYQGDIILQEALKC
jgi:phosphoribosylformimino-5-aminoimidazole carboxamide ribotide isomerase